MTRYASSGRCCQPSRTVIPLLGLARALLLRKLGSAGVAALYGRASRWYEHHDLPAEAIEAALAAGEFERAAQMVEQLSPLLLAGSQYYTLRRWIEHLPQELWAARPMVCLAYAWPLFLSSNLAASVTPLEEAERLFRREANSVGLVWWPLYAPWPP